MPAAQSFIQILGTFLALFFNFEALNFSSIKNNPFIYKTSKSIVNKGF